MSEAVQEAHCLRCGTVMEAGYTTAIGLMGGNSAAGDPKLVFVVPGEPISGNPIEAFQQGLHGEQANAAYLLRGRRCLSCGGVELLATNPIPWTP